MSLGFFWMKNIIGEIEWYVIFIFSKNYRLNPWAASKLDRTPAFVPPFSEHFRSRCHCDGGLRSPPLCTEILNAPLGLDRFFIFFFSVLIEISIELMYRYYKHYALVWSSKQRGIHSFDKNLFVKHQQKKPETGQSGVARLGVLLVAPEPWHCCCADSFRIPFGRATVCLRPCGGPAPGATFRRAWWRPDEWRVAIAIRYSSGKNHIVWMWSRIRIINFRGKTNVWCIMLLSRGLSMSKRSISISTK